ncbi:MAG: hypothetical protein H6667_23895 [Ardenticatenaceae bacterium]|nr:hypothetical protein [Ardenticatenaceae bacterium]
MGLQLLSTIMAVWGAIMVIGTVFKLDFYWDTNQMAESRKMFGERGAIILHTAVGLLMIGLGIWVIIGEVGGS